MKCCKFCGYEKLVKHGIYSEKQRYKCKKCLRDQMEFDRRKKYSPKIMQTAMILFSEGNNYRRIARILNKIYKIKISYQLIVHWIKNKVTELPENTEKNNISKEIAIVELDELYTFFKKNRIKSEYGLLLTETDSICLHFGLDQEQKRAQEEFITK